MKINTYFKINVIVIIIISSRQRSDQDRHQLQSLCLIPILTFRLAPVITSISSVRDQVRDHRSRLNSPLSLIVNTSRGPEDILI